MSRFGRKFSGALLISGGITVIVFDIFIQFTYEHFKIDTEKNCLLGIIAVISAAALAFPLAALFYGRFFAKYFKAREYTLRVSRDIPFFRNFTIIAAAVICADFIFLYNRSVPFFESAYLDARMRIKILDLSPDNEATRLLLLKNSYNDILDFVFYAVIGACIAETVILIISARRLVMAYRAQGSILLFK